MAHPTISVVIPAYNAARFLERTLASILGQTFADWDAVIVNDGSTDATESVAKAFAAQDARFRVVSIPNGGVSNARNVGFSYTEGSYVAFLDADDELLPDNFTRKLARFEADPDLGLVHCDMRVVDEHSEPTGKIESGKEGWVLRDLLLWNGCVIPAPSSALLRRDVVEVVGGFSTQLSTASDQEFFFRVAAKFKIGREPEPLGLYRIHSQNMHSNIPLNERDHRLVYKLAAEYGLFGSGSFRRYAQARMLLIQAGNWWKLGNNRMRGARLVVEAFWHSPRALVERVAGKIF